jgi:rhodanese-related sulfurtransferase
MNRYIKYLAGVFCLVSSLYADVADEGRFKQSFESVQQATYGHVDAKGLKALLDANTPAILLDARGSKWHDQSKIPGALLFSYEDDPLELERLGIQKDQLVIVYCFSFDCPLSRRLAAKLISWGYQNVIEYPAGLEEWRDVAKYPTELIETSS